MTKLGTTMKKQIFLIAAIALIISAALVIYMLAKNQARPEGHFEILLLKYGGYEIPNGYRNTVEFEKLIDENDVEIYDWTSQEVFLTKLAGERLKKNYGAHFTKANNKEFTVKLNGDKVYDGFIVNYDALDILPQKMPPEFGIPVIFISENSKNKVLLKFWPDGRNLYPSPPQLMESDWAIVKNNNIKEFFQKIGKLK